MKNTGGTRENAIKEKASSEQQTLSRALAFLTSIASTCVSLSAAEIADELKVSKPTAYTIINSMVAQGYLEKEADNGKFHIGYRFYVMGQNYPRLYPFLSYADSYARRLHDRLGLRVNLCVFKPPMTALVIASKDESLVPRHSGGYLMPAHLSASGKVMLSALPEDVAREYIMSSDLFPLTENTITAPEKLLEELGEIREQGYALDNEEFVPGSVCVAAPVYNAAGAVICTISVAKCPIERFQAERENLIRDIKTTAMQISLDMGYSRDPRRNF